MRVAFRSRVLRCGGLSRSLLVVATAVLGCGDDDDGAMVSGADTGDATTSPVSTTAVMTTIGSEPETGLASSSGDSSSTGSESDSGDPNLPPCPYTPIEGDPSFNFELVGYGFSEPVLALGDPTEPDRLFVLQQFGAIKILEPGEIEAPVDNFLQLQVLGGGERGLLGMAFHPDFPDDPRVYVYYTAPDDGRSRIEEYMLDPDDPNRADPASARIILELYQGNATHHGGGMAFDDDGWLLISLGDGAESSTPRDTGVLHSKFIRIGVEPDGTMDNPLACQGCPQFGPFDYTVPPDNPFANDPAYAPEIWAMGFRNPWRWWRDVQNGDIFVGDVGADGYEEVDFVVAGGDYGWSALEGNNCFAQAGCDTSAAPNQPNSSGMVAPLVDYPHDVRCAVIGGAVYRSCEVPAWQGTYFHGDYCTGEISALRFDGHTVEDLGVVVQENLAPLGSGYNAWGDVYFTGGMFHGELYRLAPSR